MRFTNEIIIDVPRAEVVKYFDTPELMKHWQPELQSFEPISGTPGQPGATSRLKYKFGNDEFEMIETITERNLPDEFCGQYEARGMVNTIRNRFSDLGPDQTKMKSESEFTWGRNPVLWCMGWIMLGGFKKRSMGYLQNFKAFAEKQHA